MPTARLEDIDRVVSRATPQPSNGHAVRRVTGSANIPITPEGHEQAEEMAEKYSEKFDHVFCGPEQRSIETAEKFGHPIVLKGLAAWSRGSYEGYPAKSVAPAMKALILNPTKIPPGKSPMSGQPGESYSAFWKPLGHVMRTLKDVLKPEERILLVTSGGNLQAIDQLAESNFPAKLSPEDLKKIAACPYWSDTGRLFRLTDDGLEKVSDNKESGSVYLCEHAFTKFNGPPADSKNGGGPNQPENKAGPAGAEEHDYSSTQVNLPEDIANKIREFSAKIPDHHLAKDGRETEPHITLLWGVHSADPDESAEALKSHRHIKAELRHTSLFPASAKHPEHDVLKMEVHSPDLHSARSKLNSAVKNTQTFPSYRPHVTIAYLKPGEGKKYAGKMIPGVSGRSTKFDHVEFSSKNGEKTKMPLTGHQASSK